MNTRRTENSQGQFDWEFSEVSQAADLMPKNFDWANPASIPEALMVKENDQRQVWRIKVNGDIYYTKLYLRNGRHWQIKRYLRGPVSYKEWSVANYALKHGINCVSPVAYAVSTTSSSSIDSLLITAGKPGAIPLTDYWRSMRPVCDSQSHGVKIVHLVDALAELLARAHQAGISHSDLHPGNLLVEKQANDCPRVCLVDLHSVRVGTPVSDHEAISNLAQLNQWFRQNATLTQRMRLLKKYMAYRKSFDQSDRDRWSDRTFKHWALALDQAAAKHARKLLASRDRRSMRNGKYFKKIQLSNHWQAHVFLKTKHPVGYSQASELEFKAEDWKKILSSPEQILDEFVRQTRPIKNSRSTLVCRGVLKIGPHEVPVVVKRHIRRKKLAALWDCLRKSRSLRAWKLSFAMLHRQLPVAQPLAVLERRIGPYLSDSIFITEEVRPSTNLRFFITSVLPVIPAEKRRAIKLAINEQLSALLRKMHRNGFAHRDMKATNVLMYNLPSTLPDSLDLKSLRVVLVDLDGLKHRKPSKRDQLRALARLSLSADLSPLITATDRARFLKKYLTCYGSGVPDWKSLWRDIQAERERNFQDHIPG